ncbi:hypothetical protein K458DRAFT_387139 [Lentithecium fluviatile CBS 122367]|uniref:Uncharacterized protein n=1 Tax=Lentithecium fluviatile CBS 122367 TaxID=1168545 RepID=A0A6G1J6U9_9PLEO|nr:hypothetical protein K458DRAFT_387139 [Lentithecium fluviatile CBS 122367]
MTTKGSTYILESEEEIIRLSNQHDLIKDEAEGLVLAPINLAAKPLRILNSATADGTWIRDLTQDYAAMPHDFVGTDIDSSNEPKNPVSHQTYQIQDIQSPGLPTGGPMQKQIVSTPDDLVKPGGWIQLIEATNESHESHGLAVAIVGGIYSAFSSSLKLTKELLEWLKELGFEDVQYHDIDTKLGPLNPNLHLAKQGVYSTAVTAKSVAYYGSTLPAGMIPLTAEEIANAPDQLNVELVKVGAVYPLRIVWGWKPAA